MAIDGSKHAENAFFAALDLMKDKDRMILLSVAEPLQHSVIGGYVFADDVFADDVLRLKKINRRRIENAREMLVKYENICQERNIKHDAVVEGGNPRFVIIQMAVARDCDMLVLGARGLGTLQRFVISFVGRITDPLTKSDLFLVPRAITV